MYIYIYIYLLILFKVCECCTGQNNDIPTTITQATIPISNSMYVKEIRKTKESRIQSLSSDMHCRNVKPKVWTCKSTGNNYFKRN